MFPKVLLYTTLVVLSIQSCAKGISYRSDAEIPTGQEVTLLSSEEGVVVGSFSASSTLSQQLSASGSISGTSLVLPAGALSGDTSITLEIGTSLTDLDLSALGISGDVQEGSSPVVVSSSNRQNPTSPMTLVLPISLGLSFSLTNKTTDNVAVLYKIEDYATGEFRDGVLAADQVEITGAKVFFKTGFFGAFQLVFTEKKVTVAEVKEVVTTQPPKTKRQERIEASATPSPSPAMPPPLPSTGPPPVSLAVISHPLPLDLGSYTVGGSDPSPKLLTLRNFSTSIITFETSPSSNGIRWDGYDWPGVGGTCGATLAAGSTCIVAIEYNKDDPGASIAGLKSLIKEIPYNVNGVNEVLPLNAFNEVLSGPAQSFCLYSGAETYAPGQCPGWPMSLFNLVKTPMTLQVVDAALNPVPLNSGPLAVDVRSTDPETISISVTVPETGIVDFIWQAATPNGAGFPAQWRLSAKSGSFYAERQVQVSEICSSTPMSAPFQAGNGTMDNPYVICTPSQFEAIADSSANLSLFYTMAADISLTGRVLPINVSTHPFVGGLEGNGKRISGAFLNSPTANYVGIFSVINGATIKNVEIFDPHIVGKDYVGALGGEIVNGTIENVNVIFNSSSKSIGTHTSSNYVGALAGSMADTTGIGLKLDLGPTAGEIRVAGKTTVGGLVGKLLGTSSIEKSLVMNRGKIVSGDSYSNLGGLVGHVASSNAIVKTSKVAQDSEIYATHASGTESYIGGLVGSLDGSLLDSIFLGNLTGTGTAQTSGGTAGQATSTAVVSRVVANFGTFPSSGTRGGIIGSNLSTDSCDSDGYGCVHHNSVTPACNDSPCPKIVSSAFPLDFSGISTEMGSGNFGVGSTWMMLQSGPDVPMLQWERAAKLTTGGGTIEDMGLTVQQGLSAQRNVATNCKASGKWYWEVEVLNGDYEMEIGAVSSSVSSSPTQGLAFSSGVNQAFVLGDMGGSFVPYVGNARDPTFAPPNYSIVELNSTYGVGAAWGDVIGVALDKDSSKITFYRNGIQLVQKGAVSASYTISRAMPATVCAGVGRVSGSSTPSFTNILRLNFGTKPFRHSIPSGFLPYNFKQ